MASSGGSSFPAVDVDKELNPGKHKSLQTDSTSAEITAALEIKDENEKSKMRREKSKKRQDKEKKDAVQRFKSAILISGIIAAVAGAVFAITKKLREK